MFTIRKAQLVQMIKILFPLLLLVLAVFEIQQVARGVDINLLRNEVSQLQLWELGLILIVSLLAITPMFFYDILLVKVLGIQLKARELIRHSFIANSFSNLIGFGGLVGFFLRNYFYSKYKEEKEGMLKNIASVTFFYLTGISLLAWLVPLFFRGFSLLSEEKWLFLAVIGVSLYAPIFISIYVIRSKKSNTASFSHTVAVQLIITSIVEWLAVFAVIWFLTFVLMIPIGLSALIPIFLIATCAGIASMIPGGLGSFDLVFLWGTQSVGIADEKVLVLLVLYRLGYFILPFLFATFLFIKEYWTRWNQSWGNVPNELFQKTSHSLLTVLVFTSGIILLLSASVPGVLSRLKIAQEFLSLPIMQVSHQLTVAAGFILLGLCRGIEYKVKGAFNLALIVLTSAVLFSVFKGFDYEEAIFLLIVMALLMASKRQFYRKSYVLTWGKILFDAVVVIIITGTYVSIGYFNLPSVKFHIPASLQGFIITDYRDLFYSAIIGIIIAVVILVVGYLIRRPKRMVMMESIHQEAQIRNISEVYGH